MTTVAQGIIKNKANAIILRSCYVMIMVLISSHDLHVGTTDLRAMALLNCTSLGNTLKPIEPLFVRNLHSTERLHPVSESSLLEKTSGNSNEWMWSRLGANPGMQ